MISKMGKEISVLQDADEKASDNFKAEFASLTKSLADSQDAVVNLKVTLHFDFKYTLTNSM